jgi:hypothetical protein
VGRSVRVGHLSSVDVHRVLVPGVVLSRVLARRSSCCVQLLELVVLEVLGARVLVGPGGGVVVDCSVHED